MKKSTKKIEFSTSFISHFQLFQSEEGTESKKNCIYLFLMKILIQYFLFRNKIIYFSLFQFLKLKRKKFNKIKGFLKYIKFK